MVTIKYKERFKKDHFERGEWQENRLVCGIDEVGRGCLAGPVVVAAAILFPNKKSSLIKDSKLLDAEQLQKAYKWLLRNSWHSVALVNHRDIDIYNIYYATLRAMKRATMQLFSNCPEKPSIILVDAMPLNLAKTSYEQIPLYHFPFGESKSSSIAAASILAKVKRDELMRRMSTSFPQYHFARHKGYCTKLHQEAVSKHGRSIIHRLRFLENKPFAQGEQENEGEQQSLC